MELHRLGCDRCGPLRASSSACSGDRVFVLDVLVVSVFGGGGGGRGGAGYVWPRAVDVFL